MSSSMDAGTVEGALILRDLASEVLARVNRSLDEFDQKTRRTQSTVSGASDRLAAMGTAATKLGQQLKSMGSQLTMSLTLPMAAAGAGALKLGMDFDRSMTQVETLSGVAADRVAEFRKEIEAMAGDVGRGPNELAKGLLVVTSTGLRGAEAMDVLQTSAKAAAVGLGETNDVARAITSAMNAYGKENLSAARAGDILLAAVREGGAEANEFAGTLGRVVGIASQVGVSFEEVTSYIATFTRLGVDASEATTSLRGVLGTILGPTREAQAALANYGLSIDDLRTSIKDKGLAETLTSLMKTFEGDAAAADAVFGNVRALAGVMANAGSQANAYKDVLESVTDSSGDLATAFERVAETPAHTWAQFKAQAEEAAIALGSALAPAMVSVLDAAKPLLDAIVSLSNGFKELPSSAQKAIVTIAGIGLLAGPVLSVASNVATLFGWIIKMATAKVVIDGLASAQVGLALATTRAAAAVTSQAPTVGALVARYNLWLGAILLVSQALHELYNMNNQQRFAVAAEAVNGLTGGMLGLAAAAREYFDALNQGAPSLAKTIEDMKKLRNDQKNGVGQTKGGVPVPTFADARRAWNEMNANDAKAAKGTSTLVDQMNAAKKALNEATPITLANVRAGLEMNKTTEDIVLALRSVPGATQLSAAAIELYKDRLQAAAKATRDAKKAKDEWDVTSTRMEGSDLGGNGPGLMGALNAGREAANAAVVSNEEANAAKLIELTRQISVERIRISQGETAARIREAENLYATEKRNVDITAANAGKVLTALDTMQQMTLSSIIVSSEEARLPLEALAAALMSIPGFVAQGQEVLSTIGGSFSGAGEDSAKGFKAGWDKFDWSSLGDAVLRAIEGGGNIGVALVGALGQELQRAFKDTKSIGGKIAGGIGAGITAGIAGASVTAERESKAMGALAGAASGAAAGAAFGPWGAAIGGAIGLIGGMLGDAGKKARELRKQLIDDAGGIDQLRKSAEWAGVSLDKLLNAKKAKDVQAAFDEITAAVEATRERVESLVAEIGRVADSADLISVDLLLRINGDKSKDEVQKAIGEFMKANTSRAVDGLNAWLTLPDKTFENLSLAQKSLRELKGEELSLLKTIGDLEGKSLSPVESNDLEEARTKLSMVRREIEETSTKVEKLQTLFDSLKISPETAGAAQAGIVGLFGDMLSQGSSPADALAKMMPAIQSLGASLDNAGITGSDAFLQLARMANMASDAVTGPLISAVSGLGQGLVGLHNTGLLTGEMFSGLARGAYDAFHALELQGKGGVDAARLMQPTLQKIWELQRDFGYQVDANTQGLLDFAESSGIIGDKFRPAQDKMVAALDLLIGRFDNLINLLSGNMPAEAEAAGRDFANSAGAMGRAVDGIGAALARVDFETFAQRAEDAFARAEAAATGTAWGHSPTGIKEIPIATQQAMDKLNEFGPYAKRVFATVEDLATGYARQVVAKGDDLGSMLVGLSQSFEDLIASPLQKAMNGIDRELWSTLNGLAEFKNDPRYQQAVELANQIADIKGREAMVAERERLKREADAAYRESQKKPEPTVEQIVVVHLDGHVLTEAHLKNFPEVAKIVAR